MSDKPIPVWILIDALQDTVHKDIGKVKLVRAIKQKRSSNKMKFAHIVFSKRYSPIARFSDKLEAVFCDKKKAKQFVKVKNEKALNLVYFMVSKKVEDLDE